MFGTTIVIWLVLLVLALNVIAFVTRIIEKRRLPHDFSRRSERAVSVMRNSELAVLKHQRTRRRKQFTSSRFLSSREE
jgi:hypothetical protein